MNGEDTFATDKNFPSATLENGDIEVIRIQVAPSLIPKRTHLYCFNMLQIWDEAPILGRLYI